MSTFYAKEPNPCSDPYVYRIGYRDPFYRPTDFKAPVPPPLGDKIYTVRGDGNMSDVIEEFLSISKAEERAVALARTYPNRTFTVSESKFSFKLRDVLPVDKKIHV